MKPKLKPLINFKMNIDQIKHQIYHHFRIQYKVTLTQAQLDDMHEFYHDFRKQTIKQISYYRYVNMMLGIIFLISLLLLCESIVGSWFEILILSVFIIYNAIHGIWNWIQYKRVKEPIRPSDVY